ncbi:MAG TPA: ATPase, T2SS/T4P/T4SS family [Planctomycetota bacterium]|nr:ATPase, T2SS/T4P/T4SS family [Planctomycetota bacterium]
MGSKSGLGITNSQLDAGRRRIAASLKSAGLEDLSSRVAAEIAALLGAAQVRVYRRDPLTGELYARALQGRRLREFRLPADPSSAAGYAAMTHKKSFAWKRDPAGVRRYVAAAPLLAGGEVLGVAELTHGTPDVALDDERLKVFHDLCLHLGRRLQQLVEGTARATPYDYLLQAGLLTRETLKQARDEAVRSGLSVERILVERCGIDKAALGRSLSEHFECPFVAAPAELAVSGELLGRFSPDFLRTHAVLPVGWKGAAVEVVVVNPRNLTLVDDLSRRLGAEKLALAVAVREDILDALDRFLAEAAPPAAEEPAAGEAEWEPVAGDEVGYSLEPEVAANDSRTVRLVNEIIQAAVDRGASDIHLETTPTGGLTVRFRVDGVLHDYRVLKEACARPVVSRLKIMSQLNIAEHRLPQDGKIRLKDRQGRKTDLRVAIMPTHGGYEDVVLRLLPEYQVFKLDQLGMTEEVRDRFQKLIEQPHGIVLCVGPTGSGKTTTLHAALAHVKGPSVKVWTAEDPIEITQEGVRQVQVHPQIGLTFDRALRAFLRCDPDVIMIGEIRDRETADAAIEASLTGHLVLSTLHTNSAPETVTRLLEMGLDPFTFGNSLLGVLAQRLVRRICDGCAERYAPSADEWDQIRSLYGDEARFDALRLDRRKTVLARGKGCDACFKTGYKGRVGIHELLAVSPEVRRLVQKRARADEIAEAARGKGMATLRQDGLRKVLQGLTDVKEVLSMTVEEDL